MARDTCSQLRSGPGCGHCTLPVKNGAVRIILAVVIVVVVEAILVIRRRHLCWGWLVSPRVTAERSTHVLLPPPAASTLIVMCGPPPMIKFACKQNLDALGYDKKRQLAF